MQRKIPEGEFLQDSGCPIGRFGLRFMDLRFQTCDNAVLYADQAVSLQALHRGSQELWADITEYPADLIHAYTSFAEHELAYLRPAEAGVEQNSPGVLI